ncbi:putative DNA-binding transcriptional regulator YafY [Inhella inkyongensis]|uniref:Putative DNA-binding transcriptional regulator YafY n=1 Tax=Inhella inkyongensis TaxID=392593 RepID=A0A840S6L0_9BURK|nr:YafY family protein [Inhella inkyongensis]MBB5205148.1 putative DNA-binding transcriptional regulator YafY [Inhella inkyongensis]
MKASRLLSILMLLQSRGRQSAPQLARALEVSERTILRDIDQLSAAGVPVWGQPGRAGGFELQPGWSTQLTGMTGDEAQALMLAGLPGAAAELGLGAAATGARLKVLASVPPPWRELSDRVAQRLHLDPLDWYRAPDTPQHLQDVARAVWQGQTLAVEYQSWAGLKRYRLEPLGLVLKAGAWYLVALRDNPRGRKDARTYRLASLRSARLLDHAFERPKDFDLPAWWRAASQRFEAELKQVPVTLKVSAQGLRWLRNSRLPLVPLGEPELLGDQQVQLWFESEEMAARQLLAFGPEVEVLEPVSLRDRLAEQAKSVLRLYR